jgi:hypothetical protein
VSPPGRRNLFAPLSGNPTPMLAFLAVTAHLAVALGLAAGLVQPRWRRRAASLILAAGVLAAGLAVLGPSPRTLDVEHRFAAFEGPEIRSTAFVTEQVTASGFGWGLVVLGFCAGWALWLRWTAAPPGAASSIGDRVHPFWGPICLAWSLLALQLVLEKVAAPAGLVGPLGVDRAVLPAALSASVLLAYAHRRVVLVLAWLAVFVTFVRTPIVVFATLATQNDWGTSFDVREITRFANPLAQAPLTVAQGSPEQLGWLIWGPHLIVMPAIYMLSLGGIGFAVTMFVTHPKTAEDA